MVHGPFCQSESSCKATAERPTLPARPIDGRLMHILALIEDVHAPAQYRVNGPLSNIPEFYKAFNIKQGDSMYRTDSLRMVIW